MLAAVEQVRHRIVITVGGRDFVLSTAFASATFDYRMLCDLLVRRLTGMEIACEPFRGIDPDGALRLGGRRVNGGLLIDASGWQARLTRALGDAGSPRERLGLGIEVEIEVEGPDLHFWLRSPVAPDGYAWAFPACSHTRQAIGSYGNRRRGLGRRLRQWQPDGPDSHLRSPTGRTHGGRWTSRLRQPLVGRAFVAGDAAGHCLPTTVEGISPALVWGQEPVVRPALGAGQLLASLSAGATSALLVVLAEEHLGVSGSGYGMLIGAIGIGAALGPLALLRLIRDPRRPVFVFGPFAMRGVVDLVLATFASPAVAVCSLVAYGVGTSTGAVTFNSMLQAEAPQHARGRIFSAMDVLWQGGRLISLGVGGLLADTFGITAVYYLGGVLLLAAAGVGLTAAQDQST